MNCELKTVAAIAGVVVVGVAGWAYFGDGSQTPEYTPPRASETTTAPIPTGRRWTTDEFTPHVYGKTKAQIRAEFGSPDNVISSVNTWYYWHLNVVDSRAEIVVHSTNIRFSNLGGDDDAVNDVDYN